MSDRMNKLEEIRGRLYELHDESDYSDRVFCENAHKDVLWLLSEVEKLQSEVALNNDLAKKATAEAREEGIRAMRNECVAFLEACAHDALTNERGYAARQAAKIFRKMANNLPTEPPHE